MYTSETVNIEVKGEVNGHLTFTDPLYNTGWYVNVNPNGLIENNYESFKNIHNVTILNIGIVADKNIDTLYIHSDANAFSSIINRKSFNLSSKMQFKPLLFKELCDEYNISDIELLYIDTEGYDYTIINSINFESIDIKKIICELWPYDIDSNDEILTGPKYFDNIIKPKMEKHNYDISLLKLSMDSYCFIKRI